MFAESLQHFQNTEQQPLESVDTRWDRSVPAQSEPAQSFFYPHHSAEAEPGISEGWRNKTRLYCI